MLSKWIYNFQRGWNEDLYWKMRSYCQSHNNIVQKAFLVLLRRVEAKMCASTGLGLNTPDSPMCNIDGRLVLPHSLNGIIIGRNAQIGKNVAIYQHVTISEADKSKRTIIEDNVLIGAGAVILNNAHIGRNAKIGANCVVLSDIPGGGMRGQSRKSC